eukprot:5277993-Pyramimonas_sp.AAC.1
MTLKFELYNGFTDGRRVVLKMRIPPQRRAYSSLRKGFHGWRADDFQNAALVLEPRLLVLHRCMCFKGGGQVVFNTVISPLFCAQPCVVKRAAATVSDMQFLIFSTCNPRLRAARVQQFQRLVWPRRHE